jgi:hypothetical protein
MYAGVVKPSELRKALRHLGGQERNKGGETIIRFRGTTIIVGRHPFSRVMLHHVERKLGAVGIASEEFFLALQGDKKR